MKAAQFFLLLFCLIIFFHVSYSLHKEHPPASLSKQLMAMVYDVFLIFAVLFVAAAVALLLNGGKTIDNNPAFSLYLLFVVFTFYAWFWRKSGQTLGMRAWKIRIVSELGGNPNWGVCYLRLVFALLSWACLGLGYLWRLFTPYTWHDRLSQTLVIDISKRTQPDEAENTDAV